jgi:hypothetical protein
MTRGVFLALPLLCCPFPAAANDPGQEAYMIRMPQVPPSAWENRIIAEPPRRQPHGQPLPFVRQDDVARLARLASTRNGPQQRCADSCDHVGYCRRGQPLVSLYSLGHRSEVSFVQGDRAANKPAPQKNEGKWGDMPWLWRRR